MNKWKDRNWKKVGSCQPASSFGLMGNASEVGASRRSWVAHGLVLEGAAGPGLVH